MSGRAAVFMHLTEARFSTRTALVAAVLFVAILGGLMVTDVALR